MHNNTIAKIFCAEKNIFFCSQTINGNGTVVSRSFRDIYKAMNLTEQLNQFIMEGIDKCEETSVSFHCKYFLKLYII